MTDLTVTEAFADLTTAVSRSLAVICRQLIDREALSEDSLIADLTSLGAALESEGASAAGVLLPLSLVAALRPPTEKQP
jgi:hypothetical protein